MKLRFILAFVCFVSAVVAQKKPSYKDYFEEGTYLLSEDNMAQALQNFEAAYKIDSTSANINYMLGICYLSSARQKSRAEEHLQRAVTNISKAYQPDMATEKTAPPLALFYYGKALHINYKFDEALEQYEKFSQYISPKDKEWKKMVEKEKQAASIAKTLVANPINIKITNMGDSINSEYPEYSAVLSADERMMIFTTDRPNTTGGMRTENGRYFDDIVVSYKDDEGRWSKPVSLSSNVNTPGHEGSINLTPDGQTLIIFKNIPDVRNPEGNGNIYYSTFDGKDWSSLQDFGSDVNTEYWESHACLSTDGNVLFFSSERPGGFGGKDIYRCVKLPNGKWSKALNMGEAINTEYDEDGAFIHPDGQTFFFSSNGPKTMGGYDVMFAILNEDNMFSNATNMGYPINTTDDDIFYVTSPDGKRAYFSSAKEGGYGDNDIYQITMPQFRETFLALFKGQIIPAPGDELPEGISIIVTDKQSNEMVGTYRPRPINGTFTTILPPGKEYHFSYQTEDGTEFYAEDVFVSNDMAYQEIRREIGLEPVTLTGKSIKTRTISKGEVPLHSAGTETKKDESSDKNLATNQNTQTENTDKTKGNESTAVANKKEQTKASSSQTKNSDKAVAAGNVKNEKNKIQDEFRLGEVQNTPTDKYEFYFRYGHNVLDETAQSWINFTDYIVQESKTRTVSINITACASKVPTRAAGGNPALAAKRGKNYETKLRATLQEKGANMENVKFNINGIVDGPEYMGDASVNRKTYEKFQYVKAKAE